MTNDRISKLFPYLTDMTPDQIEENIKRIRTERRAVRVKSAAKVRKTTVKAIDSIKLVSKGLSEVELEELLRRLESGA